MQGIQIEASWDDSWMKETQISSPGEVLPWSPLQAFSMWGQQQIIGEDIKRCTSGVA